MRFRLPRLRRRGGSMPAWTPGSGDTVLARIEPPPRDVLAVLHGGPHDGCVGGMHDWPGPNDTVVIEGEDGEPDARYVPRDVQPADRRFRDMDYVDPAGPIEEIGD